MYESERFKFGAITLPAAVRPSLEDVRDAIAVSADDAPRCSRNDTPTHRDSVDAVVLGFGHGNYSYCHFQYRTVLSESGVTRTRGAEFSRAQPWHVRSRVFYFQNGQFAVQPTRGLADEWLPAFIARITDTDAGDEFEFYGSTGRSDSQRTPRISPPNGSVSRVSAGDGSASVSAPAVADDRAPCSAGDPADLLKEATQTGEIEPDHVPPDGSAVTVFAPGTVVATWDETDWSNDAGETQRAKEIHRQIVPYLQSHA